MSFWREAGMPIRKYKPEQIVDAVSQQFGERLTVLSLFIDGAREQRRRRGDYCY